MKWWTDDWPNEDAMIAQPEKHIEKRLLQLLLDERLEEGDVDRIESHLERCDRCRSELESVAGDDRWWDETIQVLSECTRGAGERSPSDSGHPAVQQSLQWLLPVLDPPGDEDVLGRIDSYPIQGVIGQGGMGVVLRGFDPELHRPVAIKVLAPHLAGVGASRARFMREAQSAAAVVHPSIVPIYSVVTSESLPYLVMPYIEGGNLQQKLDREGPLELVDVLRIGLQIADGLHAAHQQGVIHRDIKPANILIEAGNGRVMISDFGLARALDDATLTISGMIAGTPQFMSPEQANGEAIDERSDLFSLGSLMYALATGRPPFRADRPLAVMRKITETSPRPICDINERIPAWFDRLVAMLMQKDVTKRVATADRAGELLREAHAHVQNPSRVSLPEALRPSRASSIRRQRVVAAGALIVAAGVVAFLVPTPFGPSADGEEDSSAAQSNESSTTPMQSSGGETSPIARITTDGRAELSGGDDVDWTGSRGRLDLDSIRSAIDRLEWEMATVPARLPSIETKP